MSDTNSPRCSPDSTIPRRAAADSVGRDHNFVVRYPIRLQEIAHPRRECDDAIGKGKEVEDCLAAAFNQARHSERGPSTTLQPSGPDKMTNRGRHLAEHAAGD